MLRTSNIMYWLVLVLGSMILVGCDSDDPVAPQVGAITVNPEPNSINAPWQLSGPGGFSQSETGDQSFADLAAGGYTLTWGAVPGWTTPTPAAVTQALAAGEALTFTGTYVVQAGTITIDPEPNSINAPYLIAGPDGFSRSASGDTTLTNMAVGSYTLTWGAVTDWTRPSPTAVTQTLALGGVVTFAGLYVVNAGTPVGFVSIPAGTFMMGSPTTEESRWPDETQHQVTLTHGIYVQATEVTNQQYLDMTQWAYGQGFAIVVGDSILRDNLDGSTQVLLDLRGYCEISFSGGVFTADAGTASHPVMSVTWYGSVAYCDWLSLQQSLPRAYSHSTWQCSAGDAYMATGYRLPTEAEWEYACRAGTQTPFCTGSCLDAGTEANYNGGYPYTGCPTGPYVGRTLPVGSYQANAFGLYDMHGNLFEWCNDWYGAYGGTVTDPVGAGAGGFRVIRGGHWSNFAQSCRSAGRLYFFPDGPAGGIGFRPVRST
jgi:formylglycine-generating enzyme required for sulfatase activity